MSGTFAKAAAGLVFAAALALGLAGCAGSSLPFGGGEGGAAVSRPASVASAEVQFTRPAPGDTVAVFDTSAGVFRAVLFPELAPQACENFIGLAQAGYYNGLTFTRAETGFVVEAGQDAAGGVTTVWGGSGYPPEYTDRLHHYAGALCAAMSERGEGASVFYVVQSAPGLEQELADQMAAQGWRQEVIDAYAAAGGAPYLDYTDTVFGQVYEGMEAVDAIAAAAVDEEQVPLEAVTIHSVTIETYQPAA